MLPKKESISTRLFVSRLRSSPSRMLFESILKWQKQRQRQLVSKLRLQPLTWMTWTTFRPQRIFFYLPSAVKSVKIELIELYCFHGSSFFGSHTGNAWIFSETTGELKNCIMTSRRRPLSFASSSIAKPSLGSCVITFMLIWMD